MKVKEIIEDIDYGLWRFSNILLRPVYGIKEYMIGERRFLDAYRENRKPKDLLKFLIKSRNIDIDIEELVRWNRCYEYSVDGIDYHQHSLKSLLIDILHVLENNPKADIKFYEEGFHKDELKMVKSYLQMLIDDSVRW